MLVLLKTVILYSKYSKAFKYPRYTKVFLDENPKTRFTEMKKKSSNKQHKYKNFLKKKFLSDLVYKLLILFVS